MSGFFSPVMKSFIYAEFRRERFRTQGGSMYGKIPERDLKFLKKWLTLLGFSVKKGIVHIPYPGDSTRCIVFGTLHTYGENNDYMEISQIPLIWKSSVLDDEATNDVDAFAEAESLLVDLAGGRMPLRDKTKEYFSAGVEEITHHHPHKFFNSPNRTTKFDRALYYDRVKEFRSIYAPYQLTTRTPQLAAQLLLLLPPAVVAGMLQHDLPYEKVVFLVQKTVPTSRWDESIFKEYPVEWLEELTS